MKRLKAADTGCLLTAFYVGLFACVIAARHEEFFCLELNELGDFLAGVFGPVAFLWLVLGYLQQGNELKLSTKALEQQAKELNSAVEQQINLVEAQNLNLQNYERSLEPFLELKSLGLKRSEDDRVCSQVFEICNHGKSCESIVLTIFNDQGEMKVEFDFLVMNGQKTVRLKPSIGAELIVEISYVKVSGMTGMQKFILNWQGRPDVGAYKVLRIPTSAGV